MCARAGHSSVTKCVHSMTGEAAADDAVRDGAAVL